jgi:hypothetical protein
MSNEPAIAPRVVPDYLEPLIGYRFWYVHHGDRLVSSVGLTMWQPYQALEGRHIPNPHPSVEPEEDACAGTPCDGHVPFTHPKCGIYAFATRERLLANLQAANQYGDLYMSSLVIGTVALWGRFVEHDFGYRAQFAYPTSFVFGHRCDAQILADVYGVPYQEDQSWQKSVTPCDEASLSHFVRPSLSIPKPSPFLTTSRWFTINPPTIQPPQPWTNPYILPPSSQSLIKPPSRWQARITRIGKRLLRQPSFNIHRPTEWYWDSAGGLWLRADPDEEED